MNEIKNQIEAILFAAGKKVTYELIARLCNIPLATIKDNLILLKKEYEERQSPLFITEEVDGWKITVREKYLFLVQKLMPETELSKSILETLAKFYKREVDTAVDTLIGLIEPAMIVLLGLGVGGLLTSILLPIYDITSSF